MKPPLLINANAGEKVKSAKGLWGLLSKLAKATAAYQHFFALWKDAAPDAPILKEARAEYAKLH